MAIAYTDRCKASSWRGDGATPPKNRCIRPEHVGPHLHRDEHGNNFIIDAKGVSHVVDTNGRWLN